MPTEIQNEILHKPYKYNIHQRLAAVTNGHLIKQTVIERIGLSMAAVQGYLNITADSERSMPLSVAIEFAKEFNCTVEELISKQDKEAV